MGTTPLLFLVFCKATLRTEDFKRERTGGWMDDWRESMCRARVGVGLDSGWSEWNVESFLFILFVCKNQDGDLSEVNLARSNVRSTASKFIGVGLLPQVPYYCSTTCFNVRGSNVREPEYRACGFYNFLISVFYLHTVKVQPT